MTPTLRRSHRIIWLILAILLPIALVAALLLPKAGIPLKTDAVPNSRPLISPSAQP